jgi:hypothetical protein
LPLKTLWIYSITVDGTKYIDMPTNAFVDSSRATLSLTSRIIHQLYLTIKPQYDYDYGVYTVDCSGRDNFPSIEYLFYSYLKSTLKVNPQEYIVDVSFPSL